MKTKTLLYFFLFPFAFILCPLSFILVSCNTTEPHRETLMLEVEEVSCTEVWLKLSGNNNGEFIVERNNEQVKRITLSGTDNIIYDDSLQPSTTYRYQITSSNNQTTSNKVTAVTMDTTSHDFTWEIFTFGGQGGSSYLLDVAIIDENNIWAVGMIFTADDTYNAVHWDGSEWELKKILYYGECSAVMYPPLKAIYAFSSEEIILTNGGSIGWFDGKAVDLDCGVNPLLTGAINKTWGASSSDFYVVGNNGNIAHYNGSTWKKIASGTVLDFQDIWGDYNENIDKWEILAIASDSDVNSGNKLLKIGGEKVTDLSTMPIEWSVFSCWFTTDRKYIIAGNGIYEKKRLDEIDWSNKVLDISSYTIFRVKGNSINDIIAVGGYGEIIHYNGINWRSQYEITKIEGNYRSVSIKGNIAAAAGQHNAQAVITIGRR